MKNEFSNSSKEEIDIFYINIGKKVKTIREELKMTQLEVALDIGINSVAFYSNCENFRYQKHFNLEHLYKLSKCLDVDISHFFN